MLPDKVYEVLRWIVIIFLPAAITLFGVIAGTFDIPYSDEIMTISVAVDTFLGAIFGLSKAVYDRNKEEEKYYE